MCGPSRHCYESQSASCKAMRCQARQLDSYSTARPALLDSSTRSTYRSRQNSTDLDTPAHAVSLDLPRRARQLLDRLDRQGLDSPSTAASTARLDREPRRVDASTAALDRALEPSTAATTAARAQVRQLRSRHPSVPLCAYGLVSLSTSTETAFSASAHNHAIEKHHRWASSFPPYNRS